MSGPDLTVNVPDSPVASGDPDPIAVLWRGAALPSVAVALVVAAGSTFRGFPEAGSVLVGAAMAVIALSVGPLLQRACRSLDPSLVLGLAVLAYCLVIGVLGIAYSLINDLSWLNGGFAGTGVAVAATVWAIGHMRAAMRLRQPLYDL
jgi:hypothetical protein